VKEQENILETVQRSPTTSKRKLSTCLSVSRIHVWRKLHEDGLYPFHPQRVQNLHPVDNAMRLEFCQCLHNNCQSLPLILFTNEATVTTTETITYGTSIDGLTTIHMVLWTHIFSVVSLLICSAVWSMK